MNEYFERKIISECAAHLRSYNAGGTNGRED